MDGILIHHDPIASAEEAARFQWVLGLGVGKDFLDVGGGEGKTAVVCIHYITATNYERRQERLVKTALNQWGELTHLYSPIIVAIRLHFSVQTDRSAHH